MNTNILNRIFGIIYLIDFLIYVVLVNLIFYVSWPITDYYTGMNLFLIVSQYSCHLVFGALVIWSLFFYKTKMLYIAFPLFIAEVFISKIWIIYPNTLKYQEIVNQAQQAMQNIEQDINTTVTATTYPFTIIYYFYILTILYVYIVMPRLRKNERANTQQTN